LKYHISRNWLVMMGNEPTRLQSKAHIKVPKEGAASGFHNAQRCTVQKVDPETWDMDVNITEVTKRDLSMAELKKKLKMYPHYGCTLNIPSYHRTTEEFKHTTKVVKFSSLPTNYEQYGSTADKNEESEMFEFLQSMSHVFQMEIAVIPVDEPLPSAPGSAEGAALSDSGGGGGGSTSGSSSNSGSGSTSPPTTLQRVNIVVDVKCNPDKCRVSSRHEKAQGFGHDARIAQLLLMLKDKPPLAPEDSSWRPLAEQLMAMAEVSSSLQPDGKSKTLNGLLQDLETASPKMGFGPRNRVCERVASTPSNRRPLSQLQPVVEGGLVTQDAAGGGAAGGAAKKSRSTKGAGLTQSRSTKGAGRTPRPKRLKGSKGYSSDGFSGEMIIQPSTKQSKVRSRTVGVHECRSV
jgi:hypothetical protein